MKEQHHGGLAQGSSGSLKGAPKGPMLVRMLKGVSDRKAKACPELFRPHFRFKKSTRCFGLTFSETSPTANYCLKDYNDKFVVFAHVTRPGARGFR